MTYNYRVLNDNPRHYYSLEGGSFADLTGRSAGESLGAPVQAPPLVVGGGNSMVFTGNDNFKFATDVFFEENVRMPFTLEAWFKPIAVTGMKGILGHLSTADGLTYDGEKISFTTLHGAAGSAEASWYPPPVFTSFHVMGVHNGERNDLYVNGVRVATVSLSDEQLAVPYEIVGGPGFLYSGHHPGTIVVDSVAVYNYPLTSRQAKLHFLWGRDALDFRDVVTRRGGAYWDLTDQSAVVAFDFSFSTSAQWEQGLSASVSTENDMVSPLFDAGASLAGTWMNGFILSSVGEKFDGSKIWWDGDGTFSVETSLNDGTTWTVAENGREIPGIGTNFNSGTQSLQVRITFAAGEPEDTISRVRSLNLRLYSSRTVSPSRGTGVTNFKGKVALAQEVHQPIEHNDDAGARFYSGWATTEMPGVRTVEMWVRPVAVRDTTTFIFDSRASDGGASSEGYLGHNGLAWVAAPGATTYINGKVAPITGTNEIGANALPLNQWSHVVQVLPRSTTTPIRINNRHLENATQGDFSLGMFAGYDNALTEAEALDLYNAYLGIPGVIVTEATGLRMADAAETVKAYTYSWSAISSG